MPEHPNLYTEEFQFDSSDPPGYHSGMAAIGREAGGRELSVKLFEIPPGESLCPYHYEYVEEWLFVLDGEIELRTPAGTEVLERGAVVCFPPGPEGAHKTTNRGDRAARIVMFSSAHEPSVAVYPDSDKIGVWVPGKADNVMLRRADGKREYFDGET